MRLVKPWGLVRWDLIMGAGAWGGQQRQDPGLQDTQEPGIGMGGGRHGVGRCGAWRRGKQWCGGLDFSFHLRCLDLLLPPPLGQIINKLLVLRLEGLAVRLAGQLYWLDHRGGLADERPLVLAEPQGWALELLGDGAVNVPELQDTCDRSLLVLIHSQDAGAIEEHRALLQVPSSSLACSHWL